MINSMTGYGSAAGSSGKLQISVEMKSVNNRFLDVSVRMPRAYAFAEEPLRAAVQAALVRGKTDVFVNVDASQDDSIVIRLNEPLLKAYREAFARMHDEFGIPDDMGTSAYSRIPDLLTAEKTEPDTEVFTADLLRVAQEALQALSAMREREGGRLAADLLKKLEELETARTRVQELSPETVRDYFERLKSKMQEVLEDRNVEESRLLTEAALYADKVAVDEELVRLDSHIRQFRELLTAGGPVGKKLDFLVQELNREVNTIGSKCSDLRVTKLVVEMKTCIEKIREQVQNLE